jgi:hypothetical protein
MPCVKKVSSKAKLQWPKGTSHFGHPVVQCENNFEGLEYCTITTLGSQGVTCDGHEWYQAKFIAKIFVWQDLNRFTFYPKWASRPRKTSNLVYSVHSRSWQITRCFRCSIQGQSWHRTEPKVVMVQYSDLEDQIIPDSDEGTLEAVEAMQTLYSVFLPPHLHSQVMPDKIVSCQIIQCPWWNLMGKLTDWHFKRKNCQTVVYIQGIHTQHSGGTQRNGQWQLHELLELHHSFQYSLPLKRNSWDLLVQTDPWC